MTVCVSFKSMLRQLLLLDFINYDALRLRIKHRHALNLYSERQHIKWFSKKLRQKEHLEVALSILRHPFQGMLDYFCFLRSFEP